MNRTQISLTDHMFTKRERPHINAYNERYKEETAINMV